MAARVVDLEIIERDGERWFRFRWEGTSGDWGFALRALKANVPPEAREFDEEAKLWSVVDVFEDELGEIFPNFAGSLDAIQSQMNLFEEAAT